jgi:hypothetical protein
MLALSSAGRRINLSARAGARLQKILPELAAFGAYADAAQILMVGLENLLVVHLQERENLRGQLAELNS